MRYFQACLRESFRLFPTAPTNTRLLPEDIVLDGYHVPANTFCGIIWDIIHRDPRYFPDAEVYRPERWLEDREAKNIPPLSVS